MAHCPDDGAEMNAVCLDYNACYDCAECGVHWSYADGAWETEIAENCPVHTHCTTCQAGANSCH